VLKRLHLYFAACLGFTALIAAIAAPLIIGRVALAADRADVVLSGLSLMVIEHRHWLPALALPGIACALLAFAGRKFSALLFASGCTGVLVLVALTLAAFIAVLAPLYQYQPL